MSVTNSTAGSHLTQAKLVATVKSLLKQDPQLAVHLHEMAETMTRTRLPIDPSYFTGVLSQNPGNVTDSYKILMLKLDSIATQQTQIDSAVTDHSHALRSFFSQSKITEAHASAFDAATDETSQVELDALEQALDSAAEKRDSISATITTLESFLDNARANLQDSKNELSQAQTDHESRFSTLFQPGYPPGATPAAGGALTTATGSSTPKRAISPLRLSSARAALDTAVIAFDDATLKVSEAELDLETASTNAPLDVASLAHLALTLRSAKIALKNAIEDMATSQAEFDHTITNESKRAKGSPTAIGGGTTITAVLVSVVYILLRTTTQTGRLTSKSLSKSQGQDLNSGFSATPVPRFIYLST
jgi:predicted  nucleic acid-binding Zn-ribbon protein